MKTVFIISGVFGAALLQISFLPALFGWGWGPGLVVLSLLFAAPFASLFAGVMASILGGFFLDVYSSLPFGLWMIASLAVFLSARYVLQHYVRLPQ